MPIGAKTAVEAGSQRGRSYGHHAIDEVACSLSAHIKILNYSCSQDRDTQKMQEISRFLEELKNDKRLLPLLKQIMEICKLYNEVRTQLMMVLKKSMMYELKRPTIFISRSLGDAIWRSKPDRHWFSQWFVSE